MRRKALNCFAQERELYFPVDEATSRSAKKFVDCGCANLKLHFVAVVQHRESERHSRSIVTQNSAPGSAASQSPIISKH